MHRLLERLDNGAAQIVPLLYLAGLMLGAASYFAGVTLDAGLAVGSALAIAAELHSFLQQRRLRASYAQLQRLADDAPEREATLRQVWANGWILAALLAFSAYNATAFVAATWRPIPGFVPGGLQIGIRGLVVPLLFFASGFLVPLHSDAGEQLQTASADMLRRTLKAIARQWRGRLDKARTRDADLAGVAVALMLDAGDAAGARRIELIARGLDTTAERRPATVAEIAPAAATLEALEAAAPALLNGPDSPTGPLTPPTGPGSPVAARRRGAGAEILRLPAPRESAPAKSRKAAAAARASVSGSAKGVRTPASREADARTAWAAGARTINAMMTFTGMSRNAAGGWVRTLKAEAATPPTERDAGQFAQ